MAIRPEHGFRPCSSSRRDGPARSLRDYYVHHCRRRDNWKVARKKDGRTILRVERQSHPLLRAIRAASKRLEAFNLEMASER
jgi:hypothetical protein